MILAVDLGNYNVNTSEGIIFPATFTEGNVENPIGEEVLTIGDTKYCMAKECAFDYEFNKTKKNYKPNLFYAIHKSTTEKEIDLVLGIPVDNLGVANEFKEDLEGKEFAFSVNGKDKKVKINRVAVVGEGISSFYTLKEEDRREDVMIIDIGGRTVNLVTFKNKRLEHKKQINIGMINFYENVKVRENSEKGNNLETEQIDHLIQKGYIKVNKDDELTFLNKILNAIKPVANRDYYKIYFTGGGSIRLEETIKELEPRANIMEDALFTNCKGNKKIAQVKWEE